MVDLLTTIVRDLNSVTTVGQAKLAAGNALVALHGGYLYPGLSVNGSQNLDRRRYPLEAYIKTLNANYNDTDRVPNWPTDRRLIEGVYIELQATGATINYAAQNSLVSDLKDSASNVAHGLGSTIGSTASFVGNTAGTIVGSLLSGLGPVILIVIALGVFFYFRRREMP